MLIASQSRLSIYIANPAQNPRFYQQQKQKRVNKAIGFIQQLHQPTLSRWITAA